MEGLARSEAGSVVDAPAVRFTPSGQDDLAQSGTKTRARANIAAIRVLRTLSAEDRPATHEEQQVLARWSGWGAVPDIFDPRKPDLNQERAELFDLLSVEEYAAAQDNTLNAHYTAAALVQAIWHGMRELGFEGGNVLEPGSGSGNFIGFAPQDTATPTRMVGVELDPVSAEIAAGLYPEPHAQVLAESFADTVAPEEAFDACVGNVPFAGVQLYDARYNPGRRDSIHNHFIGKSVALTKPGGVVAVITSRYTMDAEDPTFRRELAAQADLVGAVRLPTNAHQKAAGAKVVTDVLFLRRREPGREPANTDWLNVTDLSGEAGTVKVSAYFTERPERVLGEMQVRAGQFGPEPVVTDDAETPTGERLHQAVSQIAASAREQGLTIIPPGAGWEPLTLTGAEQARDEGMMRLDDDEQLTVIRNGVEVEIEPPIKTRKDELFALIRLRDTYDALVEAERTRAEGSPLVDELRQELNEGYDAYVATYGAINRFDWGRTGRTDPETGEEILRRNYPKLGGFRRDVHAAKVLALEKFNPQTQTATKADVFSRRTVGLPQVPESVQEPAEAVAICLNEFGEVRLGEVQRLLGAETSEEARAALGELVYDEPLTDRLVTAPEYLSGDVRAKLRAAQAQAADNPEKYGPNVKALAKVVPADLGPDDIEAKLGASWIDESYVQQFAREILKDPSIRITNPGGSLWKVKGGRTQSVLSSDTWGTKDVPAQALISALLQNKKIKVTRTQTLPDGSERKTIDQAATEAANAKAQEVAERFNAWVWEDPKRSRQLCRLYNDRFNQLALRSYDGKHLTVPGLSRHFDPHPHQRAAVDRVLNEQASLLAHGVGAGKTAEMVISIMEMRRLGQARKPALVVPNHMLEQVQREFLQLYPQANILVADKDRMSETYRQEFARQARNGDWDAIIFGHNQFKNLPLDNASREEYENRQVAQYSEWIDDAEADPDVHDRTVKQLVKKRTQTKQRYRKLAKHVDAGATTLNEIGIDCIVYDEAHEAKNALIRSNIQDAAKDDPSWQAEDLAMKCDYMRRIDGKIVLATATPIANSVSEAYTFIKFLRPDLLEQAGIHDFDTWAATFGELVSEIEMKPEGGFTMKTRFSRFTNIPELLRMFHTFADVVLTEDLEYLERPDVRYPDPDNPGQYLEGRQTVVVPPSPELVDYMKDLGKRAEKARGGGKPDLKWSKAKKKMLPDNMLWISNDGRLAATDMRLVDQDAPEETKIAAVADNVAQMWAEHKDDVYHDDDTGEPELLKGSLQIVFCDLGTPKDNDPTSYDAYEELRETLVDKGVPRDQVRFIHEAKNDKQKGELFASCRDGRTQVLIGSTKKMGTGTNMQRRAVAMHHVECPWRPVDIEQREGRLVRQGNLNRVARIFAYVTGKSFDAFMWQTALRKKKFIDQIMRGSLDVRSIEDISDTAMSFAQIQALAADDPLLYARATNDVELKKYTGLLRTHQRSQDRLHDTIRVALEEKAAAEAAVASFDQALAQRVDTSGKSFRMVVGTKHFDNRKEAADALRKAVGVHLHQVRTNRALAEEGNRFSLGSLGGFNLSAEFARFSANDIQTLIYVEGLPSNNVEMGKFGKPRTLATKFKNLEELGSSSGHGLILTLENTLKGLESSRGEVLAAIPQLQEEADSARANIGKPFTHEAELNAAQTEAVRIRREMGMSDREIAGELELADGQIVEQEELPVGAAAVGGGPTYDESTPPAARTAGSSGPSEPVDLSELSEQEQLEAMARQDALAMGAAMLGGSGDLIEVTGPEDLDEDSPLRTIMDGLAERGITPREGEGPGATPAPGTPAAQEPDEDLGAWRNEPDDQDPVEEEEEEDVEEVVAAPQPPAPEAPVVQQETHQPTDNSSTDREEQPSTATEVAEPDTPRPFQDIIAEIGVGVDALVQGVQDSGEYRQAIETINGIHQSLKENGHLPKDAHTRQLPFWTQIQDLDRAGRQRYSELDRAVRELFSQETLEEDAVRSLLDQLGKASPPSQMADHTLQEFLTPLHQALDRRLSEVAIPGEQPGQEAPAEASSEPLDRGRSAIRALDRSQDEVERRRQRQAIQECIDYLVNVEEYDDALALIEEANPVDWAGAWSREESRSRILFRDAEAEERALSGDVLRISHGSEYTTIVRGTQKEDHEIRALLKELRFEWYGKEEYWRLRPHLKSENQRNRVESLLYRLTRSGRARVTEGHWQDISTRYREAKEARSRQVIGRMRPHVTEVVAHARETGGYRQALQTIDQYHRELREQGHIPDLGLGSSRPFGQERADLAAEGTKLFNELWNKMGQEAGKFGDQDPVKLRDLVERWARAVPETRLSDDEIARIKSSLARSHGVVFDEHDPVVEDAGAAPEEPLRAAQPAAEDAVEPSVEGPPEDEPLPEPDADPVVEDAGSRVPSDLEEAREAQAAAEEIARQAREEAQRALAERDAVVAAQAEAEQARAEAPAVEATKQGQAQDQVSVVAQEWAPAVEVITEELAGAGQYRRALTAIDGIRQRLVHQGRIAPDADPFAQQRDQIYQDARAHADRIMSQISEQFAASGDGNELLHLFDRYAEAVTADRLSDTELDHQRQVLQASIATRTPEREEEKEPTTADLAPRQPVTVEAREAPMDPVAEEEAALARLHADVESGRRAYGEVYDAGGEVRLDVLAEELGMDVPGAPAPAEQQAEPPQPPRATAPPPEPRPEPRPQAQLQRPAPRAAINIQGLAPYPDRGQAERASWWIEQHGFTKWKQSTTAVEMTAPKDMPADDTIAFLEAVKEVRDHKVAGGPGPAAGRYADLGAASRTLAERIDQDRQHLVQVARMSSQHAARLDATRQLNLATRRGYDRDYVLPRLPAAPYRGAEEARRAGEHIHTVFMRWARTATSDQMINSLKEASDVARLRQVWTHAKEVDLTAGPGPARLRYDSLARAAGELGLRLEADLAGLHQISSVATRHAGRLASTHQQQAQQQQAQQYQAPARTRSTTPRRDGPDHGFGL